MKLCYLNYSAGWGGLEMYSAELFEQVLDDGLDVEFFVEADSPLEEHLLRAGHRARVTSRRSRNYFDPAGFRALRQNVAARGVEVVHTFRSKDIFQSVLGTLRLGERRPALLHHLQMLPHRSRHDFFHSRVYAGLDRVLTITDQMRDSVLAKWPVKPELVERVYYGIDLSEFDASPGARLRARESLGIAPDAVVVGLAGQICEIKGQRFVLEALGPRVDAGEIELVFLGRSVPDRAGVEYEKALAADIRALARPEGVRMVGFRSDVPACLPAFDVFILGSREEAFGRVVIESMASGCLTVASRAGGVPEIIQDGVDGWLYASRDRTDLESVLGRVLRTDPHQREKVRAAAAAKVASKFSDTGHLSEMKRVYGELSSSR